MKAMILAAGFGERMRPLTDHTPKPLLKVLGRPLIEHHIRRLAAAGITELVINVSHLAQQIIDYCGDGARWGVSIVYSKENAPLETAGGIVQALPLLGETPFLVVNGDVWTDYPLAQLCAAPLQPWETARLVLVASPAQHPLGDFLLEQDRVQFRSDDTAGYTYSGLGLYSPSFFAGAAPGKLALRPLLDEAIAAQCLGGEFYGGEWEDVGTPQRLAALNQMQQARTAAQQ